MSMYVLHEVVLTAPAFAIHPQPSANQTDTMDGHIYRLQTRQQPAQLVRTLTGELMYYNKWLDILLGTIC